MLFRFPPPNPVHDDATFLSGKSGAYAKLKIESKAGKRTVLMTENTLIFVISGVKMLHFSDQTLKVTSESVFLLKKGIYVMAEYIEQDMTFEALMIFMPEDVLKTFIQPVKHTGAQANPYLVFPATSLIQDFKVQFRQYFEHRSFNYDQLIKLKRKEILTLLLASGSTDQVLAFISGAISKNLPDMDMAIQEYLLQPVTIAELANLCNRSLAAFKRDFQKRYNTSPRDYINKRRLDHAMMLLRNTSKPVSEISAECAFESSSYFIRIFKNRFGITPNSIRAKITID